MLQSFYDDHSECYGFKSERGEVIIPAMYDRVEAFRDELAVVQVGGLYGLVGVEGTVILPVEFNSIYTSPGWVQASKKEVAYLYTAQGEEVLQLSGILWWYFPEEGVVRVKKPSGWGCVNLMGETVIPFQYASLGPSRNGWLSFYESGRWGWLDQKGHVLVPARLSEVGAWDSKWWWGRDQDGYALYDYYGQLVRKEGWFRILPPLPTGEAAVKTAAGWKFIDANLRTVLQLPPHYEWVEYYREGLAAVKRGGFWGFIDAMGAEVIQPAYTKVGYFSEALACVQTGGLWGYIDTTGKPVIPCKYRSAGAFTKGRARVSDNWCEWHIDRHGNEVSERNYLED